MSLWQGHGTVRTLEDVEVAGEKPAQECLIADCGELPADADLAAIITYLTEVHFPPGAPVYHSHPACSLPNYHTFHACVRATVSVKLLEVKVVQLVLNYNRKPLQGQDVNS